MRGFAATSTPRQAGRLHWRHHGSLTAGCVVDCRQKKLFAPTYVRVCRAHCLRNSRSLQQCPTTADETAATEKTQASMTTTSTPTAATTTTPAAPEAPEAAATAATAATSAEVEAAASVAAAIAAAKPTPPSFLAAVEERRASRDDAPREMILYFAFGANMSPSVLTGKRGVTPVASAPAQAIAFATQEHTTQHGGRRGGKLEVSPAEKEGGERPVCLSFSHRAGYATISQKPGPAQSWEVSPGVHGVLHAVSPSDMERIAGFETGYRKRLVKVETTAGERDRAVCFISSPTQVLPTSVPPTSRYLSLLQAGASHHGVDERYQAWLARLPSVPSKEAEASPERINTPSKMLVNKLLGLFAVIGAGVAAVSVSGGLANNP